MHEQKGVATIRGFMLIIIFVVSAVAVSAACLRDTECDDDNFCTLDKCKNVTAQNTTGCVNTIISGCDLSKYVELGQKFTLGTGDCKFSHVFSNADESNGYVTIDEKNVYYSGNATGNGFLLTYQELGTKLTYKLRFNASVDRLYLEEQEKPCPFQNLCTSYWQCQDDDPCTINECDGFPLHCTGKKIFYCKSNDKCCPGQCSYADDNDCFECNLDTECAPRPNNRVLCNTLTKKCEYTLIQECRSGDRVCGQGCSFPEDEDCPRQIMCGDTICDAQEECCADCGCSQGFMCFNNTCEKTEALIIEEAISGSERIKNLSAALEEEGFVIGNASVTRTESEFLYTLPFTKGKKVKAIQATLTPQGSIVDAKVLIQYSDTFVSKYVVVAIFCGAVLILSILWIFIKTPKKPESLFIEEK